MGGAAILDLLQHGKPVQRLITVTEGMPSIIVEEKLAANPYLTGPMPTVAEGLGAARQLRLPARRDARGGGRANAGGDDQDARRSCGRSASTDCPVATPEQAVILASIVEKETGKASERPMIAGVYCNRLRIGMKLDADPTVIYPVTKGKPLGRRILQVGAQRRSTATILTAAPACPTGRSPIPGKASIAAVLHPAPTKALYFVADGTGGHVFAETLAEQQRQCRQMVRDPPRSGGRCEEPRNRPRRGCSWAACCCSQRSSPGATGTDDEPARQLGRVRHRACADCRGHVRPQQRDRHFGPFGAVGVAAVPGRAAQDGRRGTGR